jgi:hypothetical protein
MDADVDQVWPPHIARRARNSTFSRFHQAKIKNSLYFQEEEGSRHISSSKAKKGQCVCGGGGGGGVGEEGWIDQSPIGFRVKGLVFVMRGGSISHRRVPVRRQRLRVGAPLDGAEPQWGADWHRISHAADEGCCPLCRHVQVHNHHLLGYDLAGGIPQRRE